MAIHRFIKLLTLFARNDEINYLIQYNQDKNNQIEKIISSAILNEKIKEFKIARFNFCTTILPTFILATLIFILKLLQDFLPEKSIYLEKTLFFSIIATTIYQVMRLIIYPLEYRLNTSYKIEFGDKFLEQMISNIDQVSSDHSIDRDLQNTFLYSITIEQIRKDIISQTAAIK
ncbi:MAG: hypothetical protein OEY79_05100 [Anaplasmataceae bacterium]|nr:hypothetical protein [Anaplasmataceae bacterium]